MNEKEIKFNFTKYLLFHFSKSFQAKIRVYFHIFYYYNVTISHDSQTVSNITSLLLSLDEISLYMSNMNDEMRKKDQFWLPVVRPFNSITFSIFYSNFYSHRQLYVALFVFGLKIQTFINVYRDDSISFRVYEMKIDISSWRVHIVVGVRCSSMVRLNFLTITKFYALLKKCRPEFQTIDGWWWWVYDALTIKRCWV